MWEDASNRSLGGGGRIRLGFLNEAIFVTMPTARALPRVMPVKHLPQAQNLRRWLIAP